MFHPLPMQQIDLLVLRRDLGTLSRRLGDAGLLHLRKAEIQNSPVMDERQEEQDRIALCRNFENRVRKLMDRLDIVPGEEDPVPVRAASWLRQIDDLERRVRRLESRLEELIELEKRLGLLGEFCKRLAGVDGGLQKLAGLKRVSLHLGMAAPGDLDRIGSISGLYRFPFPSADDREGFLALTPATEAEDLEGRLNDIDHLPVILPTGVDGSFSHAAGRLYALGRRTQLQRRRLEDKLSGLREENRQRLRLWLSSTAGERKLLEIRGQFGFTERIVNLAGWVPQEDLPKLEQILRKACGKRFLLRQMAARGSDTPVALRNPVLLRPFQKLLAIYGTPEYGEIEPTPLLAVGFVLLFGMMFGDLGHGFALMTGGWLLRRFSRYRDEGTIIIQVGACAAVFGLLFGSFFGREDLFPALWFSPLHDVTRLMIAALVLGIALLMIGIALRISNRWRLGDRRGALLDRFGLAGLLFYGGAVVAGIMLWREMEASGMLLLSLLLPLAAIFLHPLLSGKGEIPVGLAMAEGAVEVLETVLGFMANTFSFLRVAAFGLAHVGLLMAVFALAERVAHLPLGDFWAVLIHLIGNLVILVLEGLIVSIQAVRLSFYEFFTKFFDGDGVLYRPLTLRPNLEKGG